MSWAKTGTINYASGGTTVKDAISILDTDRTNIFTYLNICRNLQYSATEPSDKNTGDLWLDISTSASPQLKYYNGSSFVVVSQRVVTSASQPSAAKDGDVWIDTTSKRVKYYSSGWIAISQSSYGADAPSNAVAGDTWYDTTYNLFKVHNGTTWKDVTMYSGTSAPTQYLTNSLWYDSNLGILKKHNGSSWDRITYGNRIGFFFAQRANGGLTLTNATNVNLVCATNEEDTNNWYNASTGRFTPQLAGKYQLFASCALVSPTSGANGVLATQIWQDGAAIAMTAVPQVSGSLSFTTVAQTSCIASSNGSTTYFEAYAYQANAGGDTTNVTSRYFDTAFWGYYLGGS